MQLWSIYDEDDIKDGEEENDDVADNNDSDNEEYIKVETKEDDDIFKTISGGDLKKKMSQNVAKPLKCNLENEDVAKPLKSNSEDEEDEDVVKPLKSKSEDEDIFKSICGGDFKEKKILNLWQIVLSQSQLMYTSLDHSTRLVKVAGLLCGVIVGKHMC
jgi:hypothetical protein